MARDWQPGGVGIGVPRDATEALDLTASKVHYGGTKNAEKEIHRASREDFLFLFSVFFVS
jgi:hypothetical protein